MFWKNIIKRNSVVFRGMLVLGMTLSACSFDSGKMVSKEDASSGVEQGASRGEEGQNAQGGSDQVPTKEAEGQKDSGGLDHGSEPTGEGDEEPKELPKEGQGQGEEGQQEDSVQTWKSAYLEVIYHLWDYLAPRYEPLSYEDNMRESRDPKHIDIFYFGLHDFDGDGTLELITGDGLGLAVFTYEDGQAKKLADLCPLDLSDIWCVDGVHFKDHSISAECDGSGGAYVINFGYVEGEYLLGHYNEQRMGPITINGREATREEMEQIYTLDYDKIEEEEHRERLRLVNEDGTWIIKHYESDEESVLDLNFDFDSVLW